MYTSVEEAAAISVEKVVPSGDEASPSVTDANAGLDSRSTDPETQAEQ